MKMWSKGLGKVELVMRPCDCVLVKDKVSGAYVVYGHVHEPVCWEFKGTLTKDDLPGIFLLAMNWSLIFGIIKALPVILMSLFKKRNCGEELIKKINRAYDITNGVIRR